MTRLLTGAVPCGLLKCWVAGERHSTKLAHNRHPECQVLISIWEMGWIAVCWLPLVDCCYDYGVVLDIICGRVAVPQSMLLKNLLHRRSNIDNLTKMNNVIAVKSTRLRVCWLVWVLCGCGPFKRSSFNVMYSLFICYFESMDCKIVLLSVIIIDCRTWR